MHCIALQKCGRNEPSTTRVCAEHPLAPACVEALAAHGADPAVRDHRGFTAVMWAGFKHPQDLALVAAIANATVAAEKKRKDKQGVIAPNVAGDSHSRRTEVAFASFVDSSSVTCRLFYPDGEKGSSPPL